jgi:hypothetical protein
MRPRWEGDTRGTGVADGSPRARDAASFLDVLARPGWVTEDPDAHLRPHIQRACTHDDSHWTLLDTAMQANGEYIAEVSWTVPAGQLRQLRADIFALTGTIAESTTYVRQVLTSSTIDYQVVTGMLDAEGPFADHGHLITFRVSGPAIVSILSGR